MSEEASVGEVIRLVQTAWESSLVRVKQDGVMQFIPLYQVKDQKLAYKIVKQLFLQLGKEHGLV